MMFGFGELMILLVIGIPIVLIILLVVVAAGIFQNRAQYPSMPQNQPMANPPGVNNNPATTYSRYCSHCGAGLQPDWTHCPQCGAPIQ